MIYKLPDDLILTDVVLQRWAASIGDGLTTERQWEDLAKARMPQLDFDTAIVVDQLVLRAPRHTRKLTELWYRTPAPREAIAHRLGIDRRTVYRHWQTGLEHFRIHFETSPLFSLRKLVDPSAQRSMLAVLRWDCCKTATPVA